jgi:hypothetical protein
MLKETDPPVLYGNTVYLDREHGPLRFHGLYVDGGTILSATVANHHSASYHAGTVMRIKIHHKNVRLGSFLSWSGFGRFLFPLGRVSGGPAGAQKRRLVCHEGQQLLARIRRHTVSELPMDETWALRPITRILKRVLGSGHLAHRF